MIGVTIRQLEIFCAIAAADGVGAAAARLRLSQPAVSMALAELERLLGSRLFDRHRGRLRLNEAGHGLLPRAQEILERMRELNAAAARPGSLAVGASNTIGDYLVGDLLGRFVAEHPGVNLRLWVANSSEILERVLDFDLEVGCIEAPLHHPELEQFVWRRDALCVCVRSDHPLARRRRLAAADLRGWRWVLREPGSGTRAVFEQAAHDLLGPLEVALELGQSEAIKQAVLAGLGIACLPRVAIADAVADGRLCELKTPFLTLERKLSLLLHRGRWRGPSVRAFLASLDGLRPLAA